MNWKSLLVVIALANSGLSISFEKQSPVIVQTKAVVEQNDVRIPNTFTYNIAIGSASDLESFQNKLICVATYAEELVWMYKRSESENFSTALPRTVVTKPIVIQEQSQTLEINDGDATLVDELKHLNGYYQCVAYNNNRQLVTLSPIITFILPYWKGTEPGLEELTVLPALGKPFHIDCSSPGVGFKLAPDNIGTDDVSLNYQWIVKSTIESVYPPRLSHSKRIRIDPLTGALHFTYMKSSDVIGAPGHIRLRCYAYLGTQEKALLADIRRFVISSNSDPTIRLTVEYPPSTLTSEDEEGRKVVSNPVVCLDGTNCTLKCIFGGTDAETNDVHGTVPEKHKNQYQVIDGIGFSFVPVYSANLIECLCYLGEPALKTVVYKVRVLSHPVLTHRALFPIIPRLVETGASARFVCDAKSATGDTQIYLNGKLITPVYPPYVQYSERYSTVFTIVNAKRNYSASVLCIARNDVARSFFNTRFHVYDPPKVNQYPLAKDPYIHSKTSKTEYHFNCSIMLDIKTSDADIHWMSNRDDTTVGARITNDTDVVKAIRKVPYNPRTGLIISSLTVDLGKYTQKTKWWCEVEYSIFGIKAKAAASGKVFIIKENEDNKDVITKTSYKLLIAVLLAALGIVIFTIVCVTLLRKKRKRGKASPRKPGRKSTRGKKLGCVPRRRKITPKSKSKTSKTTESKALAEEPNVYEQMDI